MTAEKEIKIPDIGGASHVDVIEILVKEGDRIESDTPLVTLESDKASMEIPSPAAGLVKSIKIRLGDKVSEGDVILTMEEEGVAAVSAAKPDVTEVNDSKDKASSAAADERQAATEKASVSQKIVPEHGTQTEKVATNLSTSSMNASELDAAVHAGPGARRLAHALGVSLAAVVGTGRKSRVSKEDIEAYVKKRLSEPSQSQGFSLPTTPEIDFNKWGTTEVKPLNKIKRLTGVNVHRAWVTIPHVTQFDEADITALEAFRQSESEQAKAKGYKLTLLAFVCKVVSKALAEFPQFGASLDARGENLIYKHYCHIGIAVETPNGLVVPVIKDVDQLTVGDIAKEMARLSQKARDKGLMPADMSGGCFTISSLGGIGGTAFTPIVNSPEVAILGLSRSRMQPVYQQGEFVPRLMLPLSLSYDHRVIDGAEAARFTRYLSDALGDIRRILL